MSHIKLSGIPTELHEAAIKWLAEHVRPDDHTSEVVSDTGARIYGQADPTPAPKVAPPPSSGA